MTNKKRPQTQIVNEVAYGTYIWQLPSGNYLGNENGEYLSIYCLKSDLKARAQLRAAAESLGFPEGKPVFMPGAEKISQSEWEDQVARLEAGKIPNPNDPGNLTDGV